MLQHISQAFSTIEKDTTKSLGFRGIKVLKPTSLLQSNREETNANDETKRGANFEDLKKSLKNIALVGSKKFFRETSLLDV